MQYINNIEQQDLQEDTPSYVQRASPSVSPLRSVPILLHRGLLMRHIILLLLRR